MAELIDIKDLEERVILAAVSLSDGDDTESSLDELEELGASVQEINLEKYFALLGDIYQYESAGMNYRPDDELSRYVRSDGAQETF